MLHNNYDNFKQMAANESRIPKSRRIVLIGNNIDESSGTTETLERQIEQTIPVDFTSNSTFTQFFDPPGTTTLTTTVTDIIPKKRIPTGRVTFDVQPVISESGSVSYFEIGDIRQAANMLIYMGTPSREFSISGRFVSRSTAEAALNRQYVQTLRSWRMPEQTGGKLNATQTPSRLTLMGLGNWFNQIKVRITNLNIEEPDDVDYIRTDDGYDVPIVWPVSVSLKEARSIEEMREFDISSFRQGTLRGW